MPNPNESRIDDTLSIVTETLLDGLGTKKDDQAAEELPDEDQTSLEGADENEDADQSDTDPPDEPAPAEELPLPDSVTALAERLGVKPAEIYSSLKLDLDGTSVSLGEFKDRAKDLNRIDELTLDAEGRKTDSENEVMRQQRALSIAMQSLGRTLTPGEIERSDRIYGEYLRSENAKTLGIIGEWSDATVQNTELRAIGALMSEYGMSPAEIKAVADHRQIKILNDFSRLRKRVADAKESLHRKHKNQSGKSRRKTSDKPIERAKAAHKAGKLETNSMILALIADGAKPK